MAAPSDLRPPRGLSWLAAIGLVLTGIHGALFWVTHDAGPEPAAVRAAADRVREGFAPGDLIVLAPFYATRAREFLGDLHPVAPRDPVAEDLEAHSRIWVLGLFGAGAELEPGLTAAGLVPREQVHSANGVTVDLWENPAAAALDYRFIEHLASAKVWHEQGASRTPCDRWRKQNGQGGDLGRWACPKDGDWFYVSPEWHRMGDHLRLCLWAHPPHDGRLVIAFPEVPLTGRLFGHAGHTLNSSRRARAPVNLDVAIGDEPAQRFVFALSDTWRPFALTTETATTSTVTFAVSSSDAGANHFCFRADTRSRPGGAR